MTSFETVLVLGSLGVAGNLHTHIYQTTGHVRCLGYDVAQGHAPDMSWEDVIVDVCTPTAVHAQSLVEAYRAGARRFIVEKPAAGSAAEWKEILGQIPDARVCTVHHYLWSEAFERALGMVGDLELIASDFDKDRAGDDARGRGAHRGRLAHVLQVEAPHQFAMALHAFPDLRVSGARVKARGVRGRESGAVTSVSVSLHGAHVTARLSTNLRRSTRRTMQLAGALGTADVVFASGGLDAAVYFNEGRGPRLVWEGHDDALRRNLTDAVATLRDGGPIPQRLSAGFAGHVLGRIDDAIGSAEAAERAVAA